jgi:hypothetical protein
LPVCFDELAENRLGLAGVGQCAGLEGQGLVSNQHHAVGGDKLGRGGFGISMVEKALLVGVAGLLFQMDHLLSGWDGRKQKRRGRMNGYAFEDE